MKFFQCNNNGAVTYILEMPLVLTNTTSDQKAYKKNTKKYKALQERN